MEAQPPNIIASGIEPIDRLMGGLETGELYVVHGEPSGKSLFGIAFLIEGLRRGEQAALVIRCSPEDAVRRFTRLGYDCLEDVYSGRLVIIEYSDQAIRKLQARDSSLRVARGVALGARRPRAWCLIPQTVVSVAGSSPRRLVRAETVLSRHGCLIATKRKTKITTSSSGMQMSHSDLNCESVGDRHGLSRSRNLSRSPISLSRLTRHEESSCRSGLKIRTLRHPS